MKLSLSIRRDTDTHSSVWLIHHDGHARQGLLYGVMYTTRADEVAAEMEKMGVHVERRDGLPDGGEPTTATKARVQGELFEQHEGIK